MQPWKLRGFEFSNNFAAAAATPAVAMAAIAVIERLLRGEEGGFSQLTDSTMSRYGLGERGC